MNTTTTTNWHEANQRYLMAALGVVREAIERQINPEQNALEGKALSVQAALQAAAAAMPAPSRLEQLCTIFGLSAFERDLLLLGAGMELDSSFPALCAIAQGDAQRTYPTFSLALGTLPSPQWKAITPKAPLRRWRLLEVGSGSALNLSPLRIDERVLHYLTGLQYLDEQLVGVVESLSATAQLVPSHQAIADRIAATWSQAMNQSALPIVQLCGDEIASKRAIAAAACEQVGLNLNIMFAQSLPPNPPDLYHLMQMWEREAVLSNRALLLDCDELDTGDLAREKAIARLIEGISRPMLITSYERRRSRLRPLLTIDVHAPSINEQRLIWQSALGKEASHLNGQVEALVSQFNLSAPTIYAVCAESLGRLAYNHQASNPTEDLSAALWETCRTQARPRLDDLSQRIEATADWNDLVLPDAQHQVLRDIAAHLRQRSKVYETWGFAGKGDRGLGISALFAGASGTGKTMAAEVLAKEMRLDLYRIDLSSVVSKYIGETEKNLRRVFDAAEAGGAILLFDEADALFGKRSDVKDSHDRYANMEVSYLLQRMESYQGLAILTTNLKDSLDTAFLRRIRFIVKFPFPDATQRAEIWRRIFPSRTPTDGLEENKLARLNVAGGNIRNIALNAAFIAADAGEPVGMKHILRAAQSEYIKLERPLTDAEVKGWV
jgi:hypothetical protein